MVDDGYLLRLKLEILHRSTLVLNNDFCASQLQSVSELAERTALPVDRNLEIYCARMREALARTEQAIDKIRAARRPKVAA